MAQDPYPRLQDAIVFAAKRHRGQLRDGEHALPYITHPIEVLLNTRQVGGVTDEDVLCAAVLHDLIEETDTEADEIEERFGRRVRELVVELTRQEPSAAETKGMSKEEIWRMRAEMLLEEIGRMSPVAQTVKLADRLANVRDALRTKEGHKLERYLWQTYRILEIVPESVNPGLWRAVRDACPPEEGQA